MSKAAYSMTKKQTLVIGNLSQDSNVFSTVQTIEVFIRTEGATYYAVVY